ncbi:HAMP domain-containing protein [Massilia forsythiae]|uniref:HAMP domain-containing protein n=1 Tax=Massilia forsythiae TaxID=2728020 RepID=A0A7Z2VU36_9BURK|nr:methyl-accepting chemotaxis protein [Massilia forsythiae]QJD99512.1 HAMP domain-containing protein [Massilia forsythiae]
MLNNISIKLRLIFLTVLLNGVAIVVGAVGLVNQGATNAALGTVYNDRVLALDQLGRVQVLMQQNQNALAHAALDSGEDPVPVLAGVEQRSAQASATWAAYEATFLTADEKILARKAAATRAAFLETGLRPALAALRTHDNGLLVSLVKGPMSQAYLPAQDAMQALVRLQLDVAKSEYDAALARYERTHRLSIALIVLGVAGGAALAFYLIRGITGSIAQALHLARSVAAGDLTQAIRIDSKDEIGQLLEALRGMNASLGGIVTRVRAGTDTIGTASQQIAAGNQDLSTRTEEQASSLEETAASMEELTAQVRSNAEHARQANALAQAASGVAGRGGEVIRQVVDTMDGINDASRRIADITGVIDGIAFQTNILALNAAVEAARAGEQGRGFAVVAAEVRNLAQRSATAAREIKGLIEDSVRRVDSGGQLVAAAGQTMGEIVASVQRVTDIMAEISAASTEQNAGIEQVNMAVVQMDQVTQQNAALVEEAAAAADAMQQQALLLLDAVSVFRTADQAARPGRDAAPAPRRYALAAA